MQIEKRSLEDEISKIGEFPKSVQAIRRKGEIEEELKTLNGNIGDVKGKLKQIELTQRV